MSDGTSPETDPASDAGDLPDLCRLAMARFRLIALTAIAFVAVAVIVTTVRGPRYEATAFLEIDHLDEVPTVEEKLRFPSLYLRVAGNDAEAARTLRQRTRVKAARGSRLIAVTVTHGDPGTAAREADAIAGAFLHPTENEGPAETAIDPDTLPDPDAADSPESLAEAWRTQSAEFEKLSARYENDAEHPAVQGAAQRLEKLRGRLADQLAEWQRRLGLEPSIDPSADLGEQLRALVDRLAQLRAGAGNAAGEKSATPAPRGLRLVEPATVPLAPAGPRPALVWLAALALGAFTGFLAALGGCCAGKRA